MGSRNHHSGIGFQFPDRKGQLRRRSQILEHINLEAVRRHDTGSRKRKLPAVVAAVVRYDAAYGFFAVFKPDVIAKSLRSHAHGEQIHAVRSQSHHASQSSRSEFQGFVKRIVELIGIFLPHTNDFRLYVFVYAAVQPFVCILASSHIQIRHDVSSFKYVFPTKRFYFFKYCSASLFPKSTASLK